MLCVVDYVYSSYIFSSTNVFVVQRKSPVQGDKRYCQDAIY